jgi:branched-chain amino acid transport system permease protein
VDQVVNLLLGLGSGAVIAAIAIGVVLTYRSSGVVNFGHAATGMFIGYVYLALRATGDLVPPLPWESTRIPLFTAGVEGRRALVCCGVPTAPVALAITVAYAAALGLLLYLCIFRPLRNAPSLAKVVASIGLFLYLFAVADLQFGGRGAAVRSPGSLLPRDAVEVLGSVMPQDRFWLAALVVAATTALAAVYRFTRFGLATRAAAESEKGAVLLGLSPDRLGAINWMLAAVLAGLAVVLAEPIAGIDPSSTSLLIVPALAAALVGRFTSFAATAAAGLAIGMSQSWLLTYQADHDWVPDGIQVGLPLLLIIGLMAVRGELLPTRGALHESHPPRSPRPARVGATAVVLGGAAVVALLTAESDWRRAIILSAIYALLALSVVVLTGYVGQISLAPVAFAGIAAFSMVKLTDWGLGFPLAPLGGALVATAVGLLLALPAVRVRGMNLAIATVAGAVAIEELVLGWGWFTGGGMGRRVAAPEFAGIDLGIAAPGAAYPRVAFGIVCVVVLALCCVAVANLRRGSTGLWFLAVRSNERAAAAAGIDVRAVKLAAFGLSSFLAGLGGCLVAYQRGNLSASSFAVFESLALLALTYLAGIAGVAGALLAGVFARDGILTLLMGQESSRYQFAINGFALIVVAVVYPNGITGAVRALGHRLRRGAAELRGGGGRPPSATPGPTR